MAIKITRTDDGAGTITHVETEVALTDMLMTYITAPFSIFSANQTEYYSKAEMGKAQLASAGAGFVLGDMYGDRVPLLGQRR